MSRIRRGWELTKKSWTVLTEHRQLIRFPFYGGVLTIICSPIVMRPRLLLIDDNQTAIGIALIVIGIYLLSVIGFYFSVALAAAADMIFRGQEASVSDGLAAARSSFPQIAGWAALSTSVGVVLSILEDQGG